MQIAKMTGFFNRICAVVVQQANYQLVVIEEEQTPLASGVGKPYFIPAIIVMIIMIVMAGMMLYAIRCRKYKMRIRQLDETGASYHGWQISRLRDTIYELENQKADIEFEL